MRPYIALIHKDAKSDYGVSFPDLPGCVTAGATLEEARAMASEALALHLEGMAEDGDAIPEPLSPAPGDAERGRAIVGSRQSGLCLLCHTGPFAEQHLQGSLAPDLRGAGARWSVAQLRLRIADSRRVVSDSIMPAYYRSDGLTQVGRAWQGKTVLDAQQVEDVVAFLATLRD